MDMKKLQINAGSLDLTEITSEKLAAYDSVSLNCGMLILNPTARKLLAESGVALNAGIYIDVPDNARIINLNGPSDIFADAVVPENCVLMCNGSLHLHPGSADAVAAYASVFVNGRLILPESMRGALSRIIHNGGILCYPDGAQYVSGDITVNRRFARMIGNGAFLFTGGEAFLTETAVDAAALLEKNVVIHAEKAYVSDEIADGDLLFDMQTEIVSIPAGYAFVRTEETLRLDATTAARFGKKLFVAGDIRVEAGDAEALNAFENIMVCGNANISEALLPAWNARCRRADSVSYIDDSRVISELTEAVISRELLEACECGLSIEECHRVTILPDVEPALLAEKVKRMSECTACVCTEAQQSALQLVADETIFFRDPPETEAVGRPDDSDCININAGFYKF